MLLNLIRTLLRQRVRADLKFLPILPIPIAKPPRARAQAKRLLATSRSAGSYGWSKAQSNQLSS